MFIDTDRLVISRIIFDDAADLLEYYRRNKQFLAAWEPSRPDEWNSLQQWEKRAREHEEESSQKRSLHLVGRFHGQTEIVACANFTNIVHGPFQACNLGFSIDHRFEGRGLMSEMLRTSIDHVFSDLSLHRIMANYMPSNDRSARLLKRLMFEREGYAKSYLKIAGEWEDHVLTSLVRPRCQPPMESKDD